MKFIKLAIISFVAFFILLYLMSLLIPSHVRISRAINIQTTARELRPLVSDTATWGRWMTLNTDSIETSILGVSDSLVQTRWNYKGRTIASSFRLEESAGVTALQWYFDFELKWYPWEKFGSITFDKQFGGPMETSLNNLKKLIENSP